MDQSVDVRERPVYYTILGHGPHTLLLMPASVSTTWFHYQVLFAAFPKDKFKIIAWNHLGLGRSESTPLEYSVNWFEDLADYAYEFMKVLDIPKYSLLGWCGGGRSCFILAAKHPEVVKKMVVFCTNSFISQPEMDILQKINIKNSTLEESILAYGEEVLSKHLSDFLNILAEIQEVYKGDICTRFLKDIKCPTLIIAGARDRVVRGFHGEFLKDHIEGSRLFVYPDGAHHIHKTHTEDFSRRVEEFLLE